jgi:hypothetical protein
LLRRFLRSFLCAKTGTTERQAGTKRPDSAYCRKGMET